MKIHKKILIIGIILVITVIILWVYFNFIRQDTKLRSKKGPPLPKYIYPQQHDTEELVVAVCMEDVDWIDKYASKYQLVTVYNKCDRNLKFKSPNVKVIISPNIGSCDHAFLSYIIDRYDDLPTFIEFTKGWRPPKGKYANCLPCYNNPQKKLNRLLKFKLKRDYKFSHGKNSSMSKKSKWVPSGYKNMGEWVKAHEYLNTNLYAHNTCNIIFGSKFGITGGQFGTTSEQIRRTPKKVYQSLRNQQKYQREEVDHFIERTWPRLLCRPKYNLVVVAIFKNESVAMNEWLYHYVQQGVDHFYMIDNGSTDNWEEYVQGYPVTIYSDSSKHKQTSHYNDYFLDVVKINSKWVMVIDLDEFVYARGDFKNIPEYLDGLDNDIGCVSILWKMFGSNGHIKQPQSIRHSFTARRLHEANIRGQLTGSGSRGAYDVGKSICRSMYLLKLGIHVPKHNGKKICLPEKITENDLNNSPLHINHYAIQSWEWFKKVKIGRGDCNTKKYDNIRNREYFKGYDTNEVIDTELAFISNYHSPSWSRGSPAIKIKIPKIIHKVYITDDGVINDIEEQTKKAHNTWVEKNKGYKLKLWSDKDCRKYLIKNFPPNIIETFDHIKAYAWKCDFFRYCLIYNEGGWYSDWNEVCLTNNLLNKLLIGYEDGIVYFIDKDCKDLYNLPNKNCAMNAFFGSKPYNQTLKNIINKIVYNVNTKYYGKNFLDVTGPGLFGDFIHIYPSCGYYKQNYYFHNNFGKVIQHKCNSCKYQLTSNNYRKLWKERDIYTIDNDWYYTKINNNNIAILFVLYNEESRLNMYNDILNYYVNELKYPKQNIFIVDSSGNGVSEKYVEKNNQLVFDQEKYTYLINSLPNRNKPSKYEILSLILASEYFDFTNFNYVIKITCKYKIPEIFQVIYTYFDGDLLLQNNENRNNDEIPSEIIGIRSSMFKKFIKLIATTQGESLEHILKTLSVYFVVNTLPFLSNIAKYKRSSGDYVQNLSVEYFHPSAKNNGQIFIQKYVKPGDTIVDIGAQNINGSIKDFIPPDVNYIGVDIEHGNGVDIVLDDPYVYPFESSTVDVITSTSCFEHDNMFWLSFKEMLRIVKPDGYIYLNAPSNGKYHAYPQDNWRFYADAGKALLKWGERLGYNIELIDTWIGNGKNDANCKKYWKYDSNSEWCDWVAIFKKINYQSHSTQDISPSYLSLKYDDVGVF